MSKHVRNILYNDYPKLLELIIVMLFMLCSGHGRQSAAWLPAAWAAHEQAGEELFWYDYLKSVRN